MSAWTLHQGDALAVLREMPENTFDASFSDPPYGYSFMGKAWDYDVPTVEFWRELLRVLKPGAPILAFGGPRTFHRLAVAMEDAGCEIRDVIAWIHAQGFPKSLDVSKALDKAAGAEREVVGEYQFPDGSTRTTPRTQTVAMGAPNAAPKNTPITAPATDLARAWQGYGTALKPAVEPLILARKPLDGTMAENVARWGVGGLAIDAGRVAYESQEDRSAAAAAAAAQRLCRPHHGVGVGEYGHHGENAPASLAPYLDKQALGRWPANVILDETAASELDAQSGDRPGMSGGGAHANGYAGGMFGAVDSTATARGDSGGISRIFYCAKPDRGEREFGCEDLPLRSAAEVTEREEDSAGLDSPRAGAGRTGGARNIHPTLKAISLTKYLATLILCPPRAGSPRRIIVPFAGSGSEMIGAMRAGWDEIVGIEREPDYVQIAEARLRRWSQVPAHLEPSEVQPEKADERQVSLFALGGRR